MCYIETFLLVVSLILIYHLKDIVVVDNTVQITGVLQSLHSFACVLRKVGIS